MGFLQAIFLAGTATFAVPLVIHLIFKLRKKRLVFSSLRFIRESMLRETRRLRLRDLLLLLLRCAACVLIALAFARPYRLGQVLAAAGGEQRQALVIVLDDSPSMNAQEGADSRWSLAAAKARALCEERVPGDKTGLVLSSKPDEPKVALTSNFGAVISELRDGKPSALRGDLAQALRGAMDMLASSTEPLRRIVVLSDLQSSQIDRGAWAEAAQRAADKKIRVEVLGALPEGRDGSPRNLAVVDVRAKSDVWIEGQPVRLAARVENFAAGEAPSLTVKLFHEERELSRRTLGLGPRGNTEIELEAVLPRPGDFGVKVSIEAHDAFPEDDARPFAIHLRDSVKALVVENRFREQEAYLDQSYYLRMALDPTPRIPDEAGGPAAPRPAGHYVRVTAREAGKLRDQDFAENDLVFLCGVRSLPMEILKKLEQAVERGKNLVVFMGNAEEPIDETFYKGPFYGDGRGLLPARPGPLYEGNLLEKRYNGIDAIRTEHPVFRVFAGFEDWLRKPKFFRHYRLDPADLERGERPSGEVLVTFNDGSAFLVERAFGKGKVLLFPFVPRVEHTELPASRNFPALIHQVVRYLAGVESSSRRNLVVGGSLELADAGLNADQAQELVYPSHLGTTRPLGDTDFVILQEIGIYKVRHKRGDFQDEALWAAHLDPLESDLKTEELASLQALFASNLTDSQAGEAKLENQSSEELKAQAPDWRYFLVAALFCLLLEVVIRDFWEG